MIKEVIIVEGKSDIQRVQQAVNADIIATEGFTLRQDVLHQIQIAYDKRGIIILTDPDNAGEQIRRYLTKYFPNAKHAFIPRDEATANNDIGVEQASIASIKKALDKVHTGTMESSAMFSMSDLFQHRLNGFSDSADRRSKVGALLGIGYGNGKQFLHRLNYYGISREEFDDAIHHMEIGYD